ncbi:glycoside hydrolase family 16 protein [Streptomyces sp. bgisy031]|uniref:glycoside hydrolase family 16 protein n=1 Tax=Streptomyces sp. bgisy031 TaxID=3413772 RepID=UPI003D7403D9
MQKSSVRSTVRLGAVAAALGAMALLGAGPGQAQAAATAVDPATPAGAQPLGSTSRAAQALVFSDEFNGGPGSLDTSKWTARDQERTESSRSDGIRWWYKPANVRVIDSTDGDLAIDLTKLGTNQYAGGRIDTQSKYTYTYGSLEARVHVPPTNGHIGAVWAQADGGLTPGGVIDGTARDGAEMDIMESTYKADKYPATVIYDGYGSGYKLSSAVVNAPSLHGTWYHTYGLEWTPTSLKFLYDGAVVRTVTDPNLISQVQEFPILSHEILASSEGSVLDAPLDFNSTVYVDYIRIWQ